MDNLTHSLVGAALGRAGLYSRTRLAAGALIIGANLPDIDVIGLPFGENLAFRRGVTHGPIAMLLLPIALTAMLLAWARWRPAPHDSPSIRPSQLLLLSYIGVLSHPALDWLNSYGVRLLHPFSDRWFYGDSIFIIDPWIWLALGGGVWFARRRARRNASRERRPAQLALCSVATYVLLMIAGSAFARRFTHDHVVAQGAPAPESVMAAPVPVNPFARTVVVDVGEAYRFGALVFTPRPVLTLGEPVPDNARHPSVRRAVQEGNFADFLYWSRYPMFTVQPAGDSSRVRVGDARFPGRGGVSNSFSQSAMVPAAPR
jgi:inner membrane protein